MPVVRGNAAAEEALKDLPPIQAEPFAIEERGQQVLDVLPIDRLPAGHVSPDPGLPDQVQAVPERRDARPGTL